MGRGVGKAPRPGFAFAGVREHTAIFLVLVPALMIRQFDPTPDFEHGALWEMEHIGLLPLQVSRRFLVL